MLEDGGIDDRLVGTAHRHLDLTGAETRGDRHDLRQTAAQADRLRRDVDRMRIESRQVEQLLDEPRHARRLLLERNAQLFRLIFVEPVAEMVERLDEAVHRRHGRAQLMRGERDEVRHHLVGAFEREPG